MYDLRILHAKRLLKKRQKSKEWDINVTHKSGYYELDGRLENGAVKQAMFDEMIERILREEQAQTEALTKINLRSLHRQNPEGRRLARSHRELAGSCWKS